MAKSTTDQLQMFSPETSGASDSTTSSPASEDGPLPPSLLVGLPIDPYGAVPVPVSLSVRRDGAKVPTIHGICGPTSFASPAPSGPLSSWENRLRARLAMLGSTESPLIWEARTTPAGRSISRLRPWTPRRSASASGGARWTAPTVVDAESRGYQMSGGKTYLTLPGQMAEELAKPAPWATATAHERTSMPRQVDHGEQLANQMAAAPWPAVTAQINDGDPEKKAQRRAALKIKHGSATGNGMGMGTAEVMRLAPWPAVQASAADAGHTSRSGDRKDELLLQGLMRENSPQEGYWRAPNVVDAKGGTRKTAVGESMVQLSHQMVDTADSALAPGFWSAPTSSESGPDFAKARRSNTGEKVETQMAASATPWAAPRAGDWRSGSSQVGAQALRPGGSMLPEQMTESSSGAATSGPGGPAPSGSSATTTKRGGSPTPAHPCWLQGFPAVWLLGAAWATQSASRRRSKSSPRSSKAKT